MALSMNVTPLNDVAYAFGMLNEQQKAAVYNLILSMLPEEDEELSDEEIENIRIGEEQIARGEVFTREQVMQELGMK